MVRRRNGEEHATILVCGGWNRENGTLSTCEEYDPSTDQWSTFPSMKVKRRDFGLVEWKNGKLFAIGGDNDDVAYLSTIEEFDDELGQWKISDTLRLPQGRDQFATVIF